ncbi:MAG TPA: hypothetical protein VIL71_21670 [Spirillospora sp.]
MRDDRGVRLSSKLPPAGFTRAEPVPPRCPRRVFAPRPVLAAAVLGAGLILVAGHGLLTAIPDPVVGGAVTSSASPSRARPTASPSVTSGSPAGPEEASSERGGVTRTPRGGRAAAPRVPRPRTRAPARAPRPGGTRTARPAVPSWVAAECRRRFPDDPRRRAACTAVLTEMFGH